jgi:hypothetical protein
MLSGWLSTSMRSPSSYPSFSVIDAREVAEPSTAVKEDLKELLVSALLDKSAIEATSGNVPARHA